MLEKLKFWTSEKDEKEDKILKLLRDLKDGQEKLPDRVIKSMTLEKNQTVRGILNVIEDSGGRIQASTLIKKCSEKNVASKNTLYKYLNKLTLRGMVIKEKEGKKTFYKTTFPKFAKR